MINSNILRTFLNINRVYLRLKAFKICIIYIQTKTNTKPKAKAKKVKQFYVDIKSIQFHFKVKQNYNSIARCNNSTYHTLIKAVLQYMFCLTK